MSSRWFVCQVMSTPNTWNLRLAENCLVHDATVGVVIVCWTLSHAAHFSFFSATLSSSCLFTCCDDLEVGDECSGTWQNLGTGCISCEVFSGDSCFCRCSLRGVGKVTFLLQSPLAVERMNATDVRTCSSNMRRRRYLQRTRLLDTPAVFLWENSMLQGLYYASKQWSSRRWISLFLPCDCRLCSRALTDSSSAPYDDPYRCHGLASVCLSNSSVAQGTAGINFVVHIYHRSAEQFVQRWITSVSWRMISTWMQPFEVVVDDPVLCLAWRCLVFCRDGGTAEFGLNALSSLLCENGLFLVIGFTYGIRYAYDLVGYIVTFAESVGVVVCLRCCWRSCDFPYALFSQKFLVAGSCCGHRDLGNGNSWT